MIIMVAGGSEVLSVQLPPLRDRGDDTVMIMQHYLNYYTRKFGKESLSLTPEAARLILSYGWPGNIREIRNISEQLAVLCEGSSIGAADLSSVLTVEPASKQTRVYIEADTPTLSSLEKGRLPKCLPGAPAARKPQKNWASARPPCGANAKNSV